MAETVRPLHMVRLALDHAKLLQLARRLRLPIRDLDSGYLAHCALTDLFGSLAPKPFALLSEQARFNPRTFWQGDAEGRVPRFLPVLGYTPAGKAELIEQAQLNASPDVYEACDWETFATKPMPTSFATGSKLHFEVRVCPVKRKNSRGSYGKTTSKGNREKGPEVDVFLDLARSTDKATVLDCKQVYADWLRARFTDTGARPEHLDITHLQRQYLLRRENIRSSSERAGHRIDRPDVTFEGVLEVTNGERFAETLARGIGRHRTFGFGMLMVRPA